MALQSPAARARAECGGLVAPATPPHSAQALAAVTESALPQEPGPSAGAQPCWAPPRTWPSSHSKPLLGDPGQSARTQPPCGSPHSAPALAAVTHAALLQEPWPSAGAQPCWTTPPLAQLPQQAPCWETPGRVRGLSRPCDSPHSAPAPVPGSHEALLES